MKVGIAGLGLIGGSLAKAYEKSGAAVYGYDGNRVVQDYAKLQGTLTGDLDRETIGDCDLLLVALYPQVSIDYLKEMAPYISKDTLVMDCCGVKREVCRVGFALAEKHGFTFVGGHPMAGKEKGGFDNADAALFEGACYILTPTPSTPAAVVDGMKELAEVATLAVVTNGFQKVQTRRLAESGVLNFMEDVFVSEKMDSEKPNRRIFDAALRALGVENREHVLVVGDGLSSDIQGGVNAGLDTCWYNPSHAENPGKVVPTYEIADLKELYPLVMEQEELANVGLKNRRHQC